MRLYFLRHGDASSSGFASDSDRTLSPEGIAEIESVRNAVRLMKLNFTHILASPFVRAQESARIVSTLFPSISVQPCEHLAPNSDPQNLFRELRPFPRDGRILFVSHEPFLSRCISSLISVNSDSKISIKKAALACLEAGSPPQRGAGILLWILTPDQMMHMR